MKYFTARELDNENNDIDDIDSAQKCLDLITAFRFIPSLLTYLDPVEEQNLRQFQEFFSNFSFW